MSNNKYPSIFSLQMEAIAFIIRQIFFVIHAVLKIEEYHSDITQLKLLLLFPSWYFPVLYLFKVALFAMSDVLIEGFS